jgi:hypothetical protein
MLDMGLTSVGDNNGVVHIEVERSGGGIGILVINVCPIGREDDRGILDQVTFKSLLG